MWQTISSKEVFSHPRLSLIEDEVVLANGKKAHYLTYKEAGNGATIICRDPERRILVQKEYSYPPNETIFQFPGGLVPRTEDAAIGANRELMEEAKLYANTLTPLGSYLINNRRTDARMFVFLATDLETRSLPEDDEEVLEHFWKTEQEIEVMMRTGELIQAHALASWSLYKLHC